MKGFRIIAIRVLQGCHPHIRKALKIDVTYFLCNDYEDKYDNERKWIGIKKKGNEDGVLPSGFFAIPENPKNHETKKQQENKPTVSISAIVGKNGDGKSSLVELMLRMIYNFGKAYKDQIKCIEAILYYEINDKLYHIRCSEVKQKEEETINQLNNDLFYTIVANYSIYAYNSQIFKDEETKKEAKCWINRGFQDNESYQQLLGLNPMRTEGNFDVNLERDLCNQRLMALYTDMGNDENTRKINDNKIAEGFAFNLENNSKFETITLCQLFQSTWSSTALSNHTEFLNDYLNSLNTTNTNKSAQNRFDRQKEFWLHYSDKCWDRYEELFDLADQVIKKIFEIHKVKNEDTGLKHYLKVAKEKFAAFIENEDEKEKVLQSLHRVSNLTEKMNMTGLQFQRLVLIIEVCELWSERFPMYDFIDAIKRYKEAFVQSLDQKKPIKVDERCRALLYVIYNTISIFSNTPGLQKLIDVKSRIFYLFNDPFYEYHERLSNCFNDLFIDEKKQQLKKKYDTLKLRQTINYLRLSQSKTSILYEQTKGDFGFNHYVKFEELFSFIQKAKIVCPEEETIALLPPPIFKGEIIVEENNARYKMSELSSGELQMLHSINTYIYHLRNLDSLQDASGNVKYPYINLILEEVELYFHPEYQRQYVYQMLRQIEQVKLENIKAINIILVTHSPIVLTDIPKNNVLFLKDGKPVYVMQENTFGANIHALLQNGFFLEGVPMGEFANKKINKMFERLHKGEYTTDLFDEIKLVSEPLLKTQLYQLFSLNKMPFGKYEHLLKRIIHLEEYIKKIEEEK